MQISIIVATDESAGFGKDGKIPWNYPEDLKHFQTTTFGATCIMGRRTYEDIMEMRGITEEDELLSNRDSIVVSSKLKTLKNAEVVKSMREAFDLADPQKNIFVIGGEKMFINALPYTSFVHLTLVPGDYECDRHFPIKYLDKHFKLVGGTVDGDLKFMTYQRVR